MEKEETYLQEYIYRLAIYQIYHDGFEKIEGVYQTLLDGLDILMETFAGFKNVHGQITSSWIPKFEAYENSGVPPPRFSKYTVMALWIFICILNRSNNLFDVFWEY